MTDFSLLFPSSTTNLFSFTWFLNLLRTYIISYVMNVYLEIMVANNASRLRYKHPGIAVRPPITFLVRDGIVGPFIALLPVISSVYGPLRAFFNVSNWQSPCTLGKITPENLCMAIHVSHIHAWACHRPVECVTESAFATGCGKKCYVGAALYSDMRLPCACASARATLSEDSEQIRLMIA